jgi:hypothetical protein
MPAEAKHSQAADGKLTVGVDSSKVMQEGEDYDLPISGCFENVERIQVWVDSEPVVLTESDGNSSHPDRGEPSVHFDVPEHHSHQAVVRVKCGDQTAERVIFVDYDPPMSLSKKLEIAVGVFVIALLAVIPAVIADRKGRSRLGFWAFGFVLLPVAVLVALLMKPKARQPSDPANA